MVGLARDDAGNFSAIVDLGSNCSFASLPSLSLDF